MKGVDYALEGYDFSGMKANKLEDSKKRKIIRRCVIDAKANNITPNLLNHYFHRLEHMRSLNSRLFGNITAPVIAQLDPPKPLKRCSPGKMYFIAANFQYFDELLRLNLQGASSELPTPVTTSQPTPQAAQSPISFSPQPSISIFSQPQQNKTDNTPPSFLSFPKDQQNFHEPPREDFYAQSPQVQVKQENTVNQKYNQQQFPYMQRADYGFSQDFHQQQFQNQYQGMQQFRPQQNSQFQNQFQSSYNYQQPMQQNSFQNYQQNQFHGGMQPSQYHHQDCPTQQPNFSQNQNYMPMQMFMPQQGNPDQRQMQQDKNAADMALFDSYFTFDEEDLFF